MRSGWSARALTMPSTLARIAGRLISGQHDRLRNPRRAAARVRFPQRVRVCADAVHEAIADDRAMNLDKVTLVGRDGKPLINPAVIQHERERRQSAENRVADRITTFSGSMLFVYIHVA